MRGEELKLKASLKIGLIGAGFIGRAHGLAIGVVNGVFPDLPVRAKAEILCDLDIQRASAAAESMGFEAERFNEIELYLADETGSEGHGFKRILINADHPDYAAFLPAPGHGLGFNDLKTIEPAAFLRGIAAGENTYPDTGEAAAISRICEAILKSSETGGWAETPESPSSRKWYAYDCKNWYKPDHMDQ